MSKEQNLADILNTATKSSNSKPQIFHLRYKQSQVIRDKYFEFSGTLDEAVERGKKHIKEMGYQHFVFCKPFTHNLDEDEVYWKENKEERYPAII